MEELNPINNIYQGQLIGPFSAGEELYDKIKAAAAVNVAYVKHLGVQTDVRNIILINGEEREIGKTGIYEIGNTEITSIQFPVDVDKNTILDFVIEELKEE